jgi:hypothetical protein
MSDAVELNSLREFICVLGPGRNLKPGASCGAMLRALASEVVGLNINFLRYPPKRRPMRYLVV